MNYGITISGLNKTYRQFSLGDIDLEIPGGYVTAVIGNNGAGKTTLLKCISGSCVPDTGSVDLGDGGRIGFVADECPFMPYMTPAALSRSLSNFFGDWDTEKFRALCGKMGIDCDTRIMDLSRGTKMKLQFAVALSHGTDVLLLDEATSGLDPDARAEVLDMVRDYLSAGNRTVVMSSHIISDLEKIADYVLFLSDGKTVLFGDRESILDDFGILHVSEVPGPLRECIVHEEPGPYGTSCLIKDKAGVREAYPELSIDDASLEDIAVALIRNGRREAE